MRYRPIIRRRPAPAQSLQGILIVLLQILAVIEALYQVFLSFSGGAR